MTKLTEAHLPKLSLQKFHRSNTGLQGKKFRYAWINRKGKFVYGIIIDEDENSFNYFQASSEENFSIKDTICVEFFEELQSHINLLPDD